MKRIETVEDLSRMREALSAPRPDEIVIRVCSTGCRALGALEVCDALDAEVAARGLGDSVRVARVGCHGLCAGAVVVLIDPKGIFYQHVTPEDAGEIIEQTVQGGQIIDRLCREENGQIVSQRDAITFYKHQNRLVLRNCGLIEPTSLEDAIAHGAYQGAARALSEMSPDAVISEVLDSGLRGRGGAGFPTGKKWQFARAAAGDQKYIICNADEGDPGAFMDRSVVEGNPQSVIEGMLIGAHAIGASQGYAKEIDSLDSA
jgi:NADP-reducing hydrogenase subunit HndC